MVLWKQYGDFPVGASIGLRNNQLTQNDISSLESTAMFVALFGASFALALALSVTIAWISREAIETILRRFLADSVLRRGFEKYIRFAIVVVGISGGTRVKALQEYISAADYNKAALQAALTQEFWTLELYRTVMGTLEAVAGLLLLCIFLALIAPAVLRLLKVEPLKTAGEAQKPPERRVVALR
ncbi:MAG: hypothetical protein DMG39_19710 [Acidobacteria bacterium]|nr:MAG: hypothetical protein DMG39_19710 [Acidobacteriota bacterium]